LSPLAKATLLQKQALENNLPYCQFRPSPSSTSQDVNNFTLLTKNLEQRKFMATAVFNNSGVNQTTGIQDQSHGLVLIYSAGKLIGIVFTKIPIPDIANMPNPVVTPGTKPMNNPAMIATNLQQQQQPPQQQQQQQNNPANNSLAANLMNNTNNANMQMLRNITRQQQQMMTGGNPGAGVQPGQNGKCQVHLLNA
jgi:hypothetical protein